MMKRRCDHIDVDVSVPEILRYSQSWPEQPRYFDLRFLYGVRSLNTAIQFLLSRFSSARRKMLNELVFSLVALPGGQALGERRHKYVGTDDDHIPFWSGHESINRGSYFGIITVICTARAHQNDGHELERIQLDDAFRTSGNQTSCTMTSHCNGQRYRLLWPQSRARSALRRQVFRDTSVLLSAGLLCALYGKDG